MEQMRFPETYELVMQSGLKELGLNAYVLRHRKTHARVICLPADDPNKTFAVAFRTPPIDNSGLTHILEHSVLCGSDKFPVKDPFVELMKTSPNTFLNAMTYPDKTIYPVCSCNDKDFANLMDVYLDAVLHPQLHRDERIFRQEGWRYELESEEGELHLNGVVYSEMKGAFSSSDEILERYAKQSLFPDTAYGFESGGAPEAIPTLSYETFCDFHKKLYHPSNSWIYLYGDCDMEERLRFIDEAYLAAYDREEIDSALKLQAPFDAERELSLTYPVGAEESTDDRAYYSLQWVTGTAGDVRTMAALNILEQVLLNAPGAPLKQALLDAGLGKDVSGSSTAEVLQPYFAVMAKDAPVGRKDEFEKVVRGTLKQLAEDGLNKNALRAAISNSEFQTREADFGGLSKGLIFGLEILRNWLYDLDDPFRPLRYDDDYAFFRENVDKGYFEDLIRTLFLDNPHCSLIEMIPEPGKTEHDEAELKQKLAEYKASLSAEERKALVEASAALKLWQETPDREEDLATVPKITVADLSPKARLIVNEEDEADGVRIDAVPARPDMARAPFIQVAVAEQLKFHPFGTGFKRLGEFFAAVRRGVQDEDEAAAVRDVIEPLDQPFRVARFPAPGERRPVTQYDQPLFAHEGQRLGGVDERLRVDRALEQVLIERLKSLGQQLRPERVQRAVEHIPFRAIEHIGGSDVSRPNGFE